MPKHLDLGLETGLAETQLPMLGRHARCCGLFNDVLPLRPFRLGGLGVLIFLAISGFLITWLLLKEDSKRGSVSLRGFYARRAIRIFPAFTHIPPF